MWSDCSIEPTVLTDRRNTHETQMNLKNARRATVPNVLSINIS